MKETTHTLAPLDAQMSKMSPEQRVAMASLNEEAKKREAERVAYDATKKQNFMDKLDLDTTPLLIKKGGPTYEPEEEANHGITHSIRYTQDTLAVEFRRIFNEEIMALRDAGQKEYAHDDSSPFANFERGAEDMGIDRKQVLWIYAMKHKDGIAGFLKGHTSQREDVRGRINDLIVYLLLMKCMINEEVGNETVSGLGELAK